MEDEIHLLFRRCSAAMDPRAAVQRASADAKRGEAVLNDRIRNDPSDRTDSTCFGAGPAKFGAAPT